MKRKSILLSTLVAVLFSMCLASCSKDDEMGIGASTGELPSQERSVSVCDSSVVDND